MRHVRLLGLGIALSIVFAGVARSEDFALQDGDTVVFMGDSITAARTYGMMIENYTLLRFPERKVRFINVGIGGDTAAGGLARLERDVFQNNATVLTVAFGINDIGWGGRADDEHRQKYLDSIVGIVKECKKRGVRVYICSAAITGADPDKSENDYLQKMCDDGMRLAREHGGNSIDVQRTMRECAKRVKRFNERRPNAKKLETMHTEDTIHLNDLGQVAMGYAILKGLGAPADVSSAAIDAANGNVLEATGCEVSDVKASNGHIEFTRLDEGLPLNTEGFEAVRYPFVPIPTELNQYMLTIKNLPAGKYTLTVNGKEAGTLNAKALAEGANIASISRDAWMPGTPWAGQGRVLAQLTEARNSVSLAKTYSPLMLGDDTPNGFFDGIATTDESIVRLQRTVAKPIPYHFVITNAAEADTTAKR